MNIITRSDFDGLACAVLLKEVEIIEDIRFVEPNEVQKGIVEVTKNDILANLPFHPNCGMWFDHHSSEIDKESFPKEFEGSFQIAPSAAHVICNHYKSHRFHRYEYLLSEVDRIDSAQLAPIDVTDPDGWVLLSYILDPRTGLQSYEGPGISNERLLYRMVDLLSEYTANEILQMHDIKIRARRYFQQQEVYEDFLRNHSKRDGNAVVTDTRAAAGVPTGNRFLVYTLFPEANISVRIMDERDGEETVVAIGRSIFNRTSFTNVGELCERYGGGGHESAGAVRFGPEVADEKIGEILVQIKRDG